MTENQQSFVKELIKECNQRKTNIFDYAVEMWGLMWPPSFVYIQGKSIQLSIEKISTSDFDFFIREGIMEQTKTFSKKELDFPLEISRASYKLLVSTF